MSVRKFISSFFVVVFLLLVVVEFPINASAAQQDFFEYEMYDETSVIITKYIAESSGKVVIPQEIDGYPVKVIGEDAFSDAEIYDVELPETLEIIEDFAFWNTALYCVVIPENVSHIGIGAFSGVQFSHYKVDSKNQKYRDIQGILFREDTLVSYPTASIVEVPSVTNAIDPYAFMSAFNLKDLSLGTGVRTIGEGAFMHSSIESIKINSGYVDAFAFYGCENLKKVNATTFVRFSPQAFEESAWWDAQDEGVVYIDEIAYQYKGVAPEVIDIMPGTKMINGKAFAMQPDVKKINIPSSVHIIDYSAFDECSSLVDISVASDNREYKSKNGMLYYSDKWLLVCPAGVSGEVTIPDTVKMIEEYAFEYCKKMTSINLPKNLNSIGEGAFFGCTGLKEITIPDSVKDTGDALFYGCTALETINLPEGNTEIDMIDFYETAWFNNQPDGLLCLDGTVLGFKGDSTDIKEIVIPEGAVSIAEYAFTGMEAVESVVLPSTLEKIGDYAFANCTGVKEFTIPAGVNQIGYCALAIKVKFPEDGTVRPKWPSDVRKQMDEEVVIKGYKNSMAEKYAEENWLNFVVIGETEYDVLLGDANDDGVINIKDATTIAKYTAGLLFFNDYELLRFDFNQDESINVRDCTAIQKFIAGIPY